MLMLMLIYTNINPYLLYCTILHYAILFCATSLFASTKYSRQDQQTSNTTTNNNII